MHDCACKEKSTGVEEKGVADAKDSGGEEKFESDSPDVTSSTTTASAEARDVGLGETGKAMELTTSRPVMTPGGQAVKKLATSMVSKAAKVFSYRIKPCNTWFSK